MLDVDQPSWPEIFRAFANRFRQTIRVGVPGTIVSFDHATRLATVQLGVQEAIDGDPENGFQDVPPLTDVPIARPRGGGFALSLPMAAGDAVHVVFSESDPAGFRRNGGTQPPDSFKRFGLFACAFPCDWLDESQGPAGEAGKAILEGAAGVRLVVDATAVHVGGDGGSQFVALANLVQIALNAIVTWATSHTHAVTAAPGTTAVAVPVLAALGPVAATKAKAV